LKKAADGAPERRLCLLSIDPWTALSRRDPVVCILKGFKFHNQQVGSKIGISFFDTPTALWAAFQDMKFCERFDHTDNMCRSRPIFQPEILPQPSGAKGAKSAKPNSSEFTPCADCLQMDDDAQQLAGSQSKPCRALPSPGILNWEVDGRCDNAAFHPLYDFLYLHRRPQRP
jgi:hypothetical protein